MSIGTFNIIAGILTTVYQFLKISELNESNRVAYLSWGKFYRNIKTELAKHPYDRMTPRELLKISKEEFDRLVEISISIPQKIVDSFNKKINNKESEGLSKPEILDIILPTNCYELTPTEREEMRKQILTENDTPIVIENIANDSRLESFKKTFQELNNRSPTEDELQTTFYSMYKSTDNTNEERDGIVSTV